MARDLVEWISILNTDFVEREKQEAKQRAVDKRKVDNRRAELGMVLYNMFHEVNGQHYDYAEFLSPWDALNERDKQDWIETASLFLLYVANGEKNIGRFMDGKTEKKVEASS